MCKVRCCLLRKDISQSLHVYCLPPKCISWCAARLSLLYKHLLHTSHLKGFCPVFCTCEICTLCEIFIADFAFIRFIPSMGQYMHLQILDKWEQFITKPISVNQNSFENMLSIFTIFCSWEHAGHLKMIYFMTYTGCCLNGNVRASQFWPSLFFSTCTWCL